MATLQFNNLQKIYPNNVQAVFDFNLEIKDKEFIVFVGPSGCGKSTTLRMVAGLESITDGELFIDNKLVNFTDPKDRDIAMVFQSYALYPHMTVYNNIAFSLKIRKTDKKVFEKSEEWTACNKEVSALRRKLISINKKLSKHPNDEALLAAQKEYKALVEEKFKELHSLEVPVVGICEELVTRYRKKAANAEKEIARLTKALAFNKARAEKLNSDVRLQEESKDSVSEDKLKAYESKLTKSKNVLSQTEHLVSALNIALNSKERELEESVKELEYYSSNEVEIIKNRHLNVNEIFEEVLHAADILDLFIYLERKPAALSGGQRQRVALGRAIVRKPKVFLMDEPLSNLDAKLRTQTRTEIAHIHKAVEATTIYVTHDQVEALTLADRIVIMKDGRIQQVCTPREAYEEPANIFVGGFIGSPAMNFLDANFDGKNLVVPYGKKSIKIALDKENIKRLEEYVGRDVVVGIRPEFMMLKSEYTGSDPVATVKLTHNDCELIGHEFILYFDINGKKLSAKMTSKNEPVEGKEEEYVILLNQIRLFDKETTLAIR